MELRPAGTEDAEAMAESVDEGFASFREWAPPGWRPLAVPDPASIREGLARPSTWGLLATDDGRVAGHVAFTQALERAEPRIEIPGMAHFWQLFVRREWWGTGLAADLNRLAVAEAAARGYQVMRLHTPAGSARGRAFYEREGWSTDGIPHPEPTFGLALVEYRRRLA